MTKLADAIALVVLWAAYRRDFPFHHVSEATFARCNAHNLTGARVAYSVY